MLIVDDELEQEVTYLYSTGMAPSEIDRKLRLECGKAREVMVGKWVRERRFGSESYRG